MRKHHKNGRVGVHQKTRGRTSTPKGKSNHAAQNRVHEFAQRVWKALDSPASLSLSILALAGDWEGVARKSFRPSEYRDPFEFFLDYQAVKLMSKNPFIPTGIDRRKVAEGKFVEAEVQCLRTNERFRNLTTGVSPGLSRILHAAQRKIVDILGPVPEFSDLHLAFGPGAAFGVRGSTTVYHKVTAALESTHSMIPTLPALLGEVPGWISADQAEVTMVPGSDLAFVPKDATTDRAICIEPLLNGFLQKGIGTHVRRRLKRHGVDLDDQTVNQQLSREAIARSLSTVDFSSASDTISYGLVWDLLPPDWCELLDAARCPSFRYEGRWYPFQKFSSMGNAYTFELETLIFYALAYACCVEAGIQPITGQNLSVYGDDVIIPRGAFDLFKEVSEFCGFTLNRAKSYKDGAFFESCGCDSFDGTLVTPYRLKKGLRTTEDLLYAANLVVRITKRVIETSAGRQISRCQAICRRLADVHRWIVSFISRHHLALGPEDEGDSWLIAPFDRSCPSQGVFGFRHKRRVAITQAYRTLDGFWPMGYALYAAQSIREDSWVLERGLDPVLWSQGASLRNRTRYRTGSTWSSDWKYPLELAGLFWRGY